jgi:histidinol-phosphate aminotransferase
MREVYARERPGVVFISSPNNPTGNSLGPAMAEQVLPEFRDSVVVLDEAYAYQDNTDYVRPLLEANPHLMVVRTFSKYYALAGARIGFALLGAQLTALAKFTNRYLGYHRLSEELALAALDSPEYYRSIARKMQEDKEIYYTELGNIPGFRVFRSDANFILVAIPPEHMKSLESFLKEKGLIIKFMNEPLLNSHIRITLGTREENRILVEAIKAYFH